MDDDVRLAVRELQQRVAALELQVASLTGTAPPATATAAAATSAEADPQVVEMIRSGNLIGAIKAWRERTGLGLAEAKNDVEQAKARLGL